MAQLTKPAEELSLANIERRPAFSGWPMVIFWILMIIFACHASTHMVGAGDTWVALACGRHFVNHGVDTVEPFSANSHKAGPTDQDLKTWPKWITNNFSAKTIRYWHPTGWINQNWLTHVMFYELVTKFGTPDNPNYNALVVWKFIIYILTIAVVFYTGKYLGANPALSAIFACFALFVGRSFLDVRPAGFSNLFVAIFLLLLVLTTYRNILYIWLTVPLIILWCNLHGGYIYAFIMLAPFIGVHLLLSVPRKWFVPVYALFSFGAASAYMAKAYLAQAQDENTFYTAFLIFVGLALLGILFYFFIRPWAVNIGFKGVLHSIAAYIAAFVGMIIFNPFHFTNLTHTYVISISKHAEQWRSVNEWHSAWEWSNPVGTAIPFLVMFIIGIVVLTVWFFNWLFKPVIKPARQKIEQNGIEFEWPRFDLAIMIIAVLTIYMAIQSRRFIPIAGVAACPIIALLIDETIRMTAARITNPARTRLTIPAMPAFVKRAVVALAVLAVIGFGGFWGYKFYRVYLGPMADDDTYTSVFMRMTASYAKPFGAGAFMRDNHLKGDMFNYWTEGGFIAWMQVPDPKTGKTPLQLFMDGRAQAAYEPAKYDLWMNIMSGRPPTLEPLLAAGKQPTAKDISNALDEELRKDNVWCVLMPADQFDTPIIEYLEQNPDWRTVFYTNKEKMLVDIKAKQGQDLFLGMFTGTTKYPDEFSRAMSAGYTKILFKDANERQNGFKLAARAFELRPSQGPLLELLSLARHPELKGQVGELLKDYVSKFQQNLEQYKKEDGLNNKLIAALIAANYLEKTANDPRLVDQYHNAYVKYKDMQSDLMENSRW